MRKFILSNFLLMVMLGSTSAVFAQIDPPCVIPGAVLCDNIDTYAAGDPLGPGASWWSTWSGAEGGADAVHGKPLGFWFMQGRRDDRGGYGLP